MAYAATSNYDLQRRLDNLLDGEGVSHARAVNEHSTQNVVAFHKKLTTKKSRVQLMIVNEFCTNFFADPYANKQVVQISRIPMNKILETLEVNARQDPELVAPDPEAIKKDLEKRFAALLALIETKDSVHPEGIER